MENQKNIGGISIERWKRAFADAVEFAIDNDYFTNILFFDLYPIAAKIDENNEDAQDDVYNSKWEYVNEAFKEIFGVERNGNWSI